MKKVLAILLALALLLSTAALAANTDKATVKEVQAALNEAGYSCGTPDGIAGNMTASAIKDYQKDKGLEVTGTITDELLSSLFPAEDEPEAEPEGEEWEESEVDYYGEDIPPLPAEVMEATGGIPDSIKDIPEKYDLTEAIAYFNMIKPRDAVESLMETGSCSFPLPEGWTRDPAESIRVYIFIDGDEEYRSPNLEFSVANGQVNITFAKPLPGIPVFLHLSFEYSEEMGGFAEIDKMNGEEDYASNIYISDRCVENIGDGLSYDYSHWCRDDGDGPVEWILIYENESNDWCSHVWIGKYDTDTGNLNETWCEEYTLTWN